MTVQRQRKKVMSDSSPLLPFSSCVMCRQFTYLYIVVHFCLFFASVPCDGHVPYIARLPSTKSLPDRYDVKNGTHLEVLHCTD